MKLTSKQVEVVERFATKNYLKANILDDVCFTLKRMSDNYACITKCEDGKFTISGCTFGDNLRLTQALNLAKENL